MNISKEHKMMIVLVLVLIAIVYVMVSWTGQEGDVAHELDQEPEISVYFHETGSQETMKLEEYLAGVVAGEMFPDWPQTAYAAQAIFARSFTMAFIAEGGLEDKYGTDISTDIEEAQAYNAEEITDDIRQAVEMTRGQVMTFDNRYVKGWFHAYSGGVTTTAKEGLNYQEEEPPYIESFEFPDNEFVPEDVANWQAEYSLSELQQLLLESGVEVGEIEDLQITSRGPTERVTEIEINGTEGSEVIHGADFRKAVDSTKMKSTLVTDWNITDDVLTIEGTGYGHGVGLSQWDALKMAKDGKSPEEIVTAFFDQVEIKKLYD